MHLCLTGWGAEPTTTDVTDVKSLDSPEQLHKDRLYLWYCDALSLAFTLVFSLCWEPTKRIEEEEEADAREEEEAVDDLILL